MTSNRGTIKRTTDKGFGFIATPDGTEFFFHHSACNGTGSRICRRAKP